MADSAGDRTADECLKAGAWGCVLKDDLDKLPSVVREALKQNKTPRIPEPGLIALPESEALYRTIFEGAVEGVCVAEVPSLNIIYVNPTFCQMTGYDAAELRLMSVKNLHPDEAVNSVLHEFDSQVKREKKIAEDISCLHKDGSVFYADIATAPAQIGSLFCAVVFFNDVTERLTAKRESARANRAL